MTSLFRRFRWLGLAAFGLLAGAVNGLLGAGGGIIIVRGAARLLPEEARDPRDVFASALAVMLPVSAVSCVFYAARGNLAAGTDPLRLALFALTGAVGGAIGACLLDRADVRLLKLLFAGLTVWSGVRMLAG